MSRPPDLTVDIAALGAGGDGIAETANGPVYVRYAAPGDRLGIRVRREKGGARRGDIVSRLTDGPSRIEPVCSHFAECGGCAVQHIEGAAYRDWKRGLVVAPLERRGFEGAIVGALLPGDTGRRRRARFFVRMTAAGPILGFRTARSHHIVALTECPVMDPGIVSLLPSLRTLAGRLFRAGDSAEISVTACSNGLDVTIYASGEPEMPARVALADFADEADLARLNWGGFGAGGAAEPVIRRRAATVRFGSVAVEPPPDAFLQPTEDGEAALRARIEQALAGAGRVADLYAGCGAFALPLAAAGKHVLAIDSAADHIDALDAAARGAGLGPFVATEARDLHRRPLAGRELRDLEGVVLDPPRAGAASQAAALAESEVPVIAYASCDPKSFSRDAKVLSDGGYRLEAVTPVDQFLFTPHVELVGVFRRD